MLLKDVFITIPIKVSIEYLKEIRLSNRSLTGNLDLDMKVLLTTTVVTIEDLAFPNTGTIPKEIRLLDLYYSTNVEKLMSIITSDFKRAKCREGIVSHEKKRQNVIKRILNSFYTSYLKVTQENIPHFIDFCESKNDLDYLISTPVDEFMDFMEKTVVLYKKTSR